MKKIAAFGDSILRGVIVDPQRESRYMIIDDSFTNECGKRLGLQVDNFGKFGSTISVGSKIVDRHLEDIESSDITLLKWGGNDCDHNWIEVAKEPQGVHNPFTTLKDFASIYEGIIARIKNIGGKPVMLSLPPIDADKFFAHVTAGMDDEHRNNVLNWLGGSISYIEDWHELYNLETFKIAAVEKIPVIDITTAFLSRRDYKTLICSDGMHPNEKGHKVIADAICDYAMSL